MIKLIYQENPQGYWDTPVVFETDAKISVEEMRKISKEPFASERHGTPFNKFKDLMKNKGYAVNEIERLEKNTKTEPEITVIGATGNY